MLALLKFVKVSLFSIMILNLIKLGIYWYLCLIIIV